MQDELISRQAAIDAVNDVIADYVPNLFGRYEALPLEMASAINRLPSVNPQPKTGHWIYDDSVNNWRCDKCGETPKTMGYVGTDKFMAEHFKFCNHCGAKMVDEEVKE